MTAALRLARAGDTVVVTAGIYREPQIIVSVPVVILGEGTAVLEAGERTKCSRFGPMA